MLFSDSLTDRWKTKIVYNVSFVNIEVAAIYIDSITLLKVIYIQYVYYTYLYCKKNIIPR